MRHSLLLGFLLILFGATFALAAPKFPALTGRVVDDAHILSPSVRQSLEQKLANYEAGTSSQVVVATLSSLQGYEIADYGYQLGRHWGIGQKSKDNGVLLIVAPNERKVRIEVGYGHEGTLTDAISSQIISTIILPQFRNGHMEEGIVDGTDAILNVLGGQSLPPPTVSANDPDQISPVAIILILIVLAIFCYRFPTLAWFLFSSGGSSYRGGGGGWSSGGGFGGFSGGGGSFGGGGASGSW